MTKQREGRADENEAQTAQIPTLASPEARARSGGARAATYGASGRLEEGGEAMTREDRDFILQKLSDALIESSLGANEQMETYCKLSEALGETNETLAENPDDMAATLERVWIQR